MKSGKHYKVIVIGSGPAGTNSAIRLAENGIPVLLLEKEKLPRYKTCGGGLISIATLNLPKDLKTPYDKEIFNVIIRENLSNKSFRLIRPEPIIKMVMRDSFDNALVNLAEAKGVDIKDNCEVTNIYEYEDGLKISTNKGDYTADFLIGADGGTGITTRLYNTNVNRIPAVELEAEVDRDTFAKFSGNARFDFGIPPKGYGWVFPKAAHLSIGVLAYEKDSYNLNKTLQNYLNYLGINNTISGKKHGYFIPQLNGKGLFFNKRIYLVGDAAGLTDPITSEGISYAIRSGLITADSLIDGDFESLRVLPLFKQRINKLLMDIKSAKFAANFIYRYPVIRKLLFSLYGYKLCNLMIDISENKRNYTKIIQNPISYLKLVKYVFIRMQDEYVRK